MRTVGHKTCAMSDSCALMDECGLVLCHRMVATIAKQLRVQLEPHVVDWIDCGGGGSDIIAVTSAASNRLIVEASKRAILLSRRSA